MKNTSLYYGILLATTTTLLFFVVYFLFIGFNYYEISVKINTWGLPFLYTATVVMYLYKKTNTEKLSFFICFKDAFKILFLGGTLSFTAIVIFLNYIDQDAQILLQNQRIEKEALNLEIAFKKLAKPTQEDIEYYQGMMNFYQSDTAKNEPLFDLKKSSGFLLGIYFFYVILSILLSLFFRLRTPHAPISSNTTS